MRAVAGRIANREDVVSFLLRSLQPNAAHNEAKLATVESLNKTSKATYGGPDYI